MEGSQSALEHSPFGNDVGHISGSELADGQHRLLSTANLPGHEGLQRQVDLDGSVNGVDAAFGHGAVAAPAGEGELEAIYGGHGFLAGHDDTHRHHGNDMHGKGGIYLGSLQNSGIHSGLCSLEHLFAGLKQ